MRLGPRVSVGEGGPGGWWILIEPEVHFVRDTEVAVLDLAGWWRERLPSIREDQRFLVAPDWVCEILSPGSRSKDREIKMPLYARHRNQDAALCPSWGPPCLAGRSQRTHPGSLCPARCALGSTRLRPSMPSP